MTPQEAIDYLLDPIGKREKHDEAVRMAIEALKHTETHGDCISRRQAIDDLHRKDPSQIWDTADVEVWINTLPSVQPERKTGHWLTDDFTNLISCDVCGCYAPVDAIRGGQLGTCFCPTCGAKMENPSIIEPITWDEATERWKKFEAECETLREENTK